MHPLAAWECEWDVVFFHLAKKGKKKTGSATWQQVIVRAFVPTASYPQLATTARAQQLG
jgi:hypothetical protein